LARSSASESAWIWGSSALIFRTRACIDLTLRSLEEPKKALEHAQVEYPSGCEKGPSPAGKTAVSGARET